MVDRAETLVHVVRHGQVHNPEGVLYGRLPGFGLSELGVRMAQRAAQWLQGRDIAAVVSSPLERARETAAPIAAVHARDVSTDDGLIEAGSRFEGQQIGLSDLVHPRMARHLVNPFRPSWGEPFTNQASRMRAAVLRAAELAPGREVVCVSHQSPIWILRRDVTEQHLWHDPRRRQCGLASVTTFRIGAGRIAWVSYAEPAGDLVPHRSGFAAGA